MKLYSQKFGTGDPLLILHGLFGSSDNWTSIARQLSENHAVFLLDQRNHGKSPHTAEFGYAQMAADVREFLEDHGLKNIILIGHSMGGKVAMKLATEYPMRVKKLIIADIAPKKYPIVLDYIVEALKGIDLTRISSREDADNLLSSAIESPVLRNFLLKNLYRGEDDQYKWYLNLDAICANLEQISQPIGTGRIYDKPVLFIRGGNSPYITESDIPGIQKIFPAAQVATISGTSHWLHAEEPDQFLEIVRKFLI